MNAQIREATADDREAICALHLASWQANYDIELTQDTLNNVLPEMMRETWVNRTFEWPEVTLVAHSNGEERDMLGFVCAFADRNPPLIDNLHVRQNAQSGGIGALLLTGVLNHLRDHDFEQAHLEVLEKNHRALAFYARMGGREIGRFKGKLVGKEIDERRFQFDVRTA